MRYNDFSVGFKYIFVNERDWEFVLTVNTVGLQPIASGEVYPSMRYPKKYYFNPRKGRVLSKYQILYVQNS